MRVKELIEELLLLDGEAQIYLQVDPEGNGYSPLAGCDHDVIVVNYGREITVYDTNATAGDHCLDEDEWQELLTSHPRDVIFWPMY